MVPQKRLQVFISSTYTDLKTERQAAVEAILQAGHIPAGMELFTAGDASQWELIQQWIDDSDVYLLILGGRYGTVHHETGLGYTQMEYDYAAAKGKPLFALVTTEAALEKKVRELGTQVKEYDETKKYKAFKESVCAKIVEFWSEPKDIQLSIHKKLSEYNRKQDLVGWVKGSSAVNNAEISEQLARLAKENDELRHQLANRGAYVGGDNLSYEEILQLLGQIKLKEKDLYGNYYKILSEFSPRLNHFHGPTLLELIWYMRFYEREIAMVCERRLIDELIQQGFYSIDPFGYFTITQLGLTFIQRMIIKITDELFKKYQYPYDPFTQ